MHICILYIHAHVAQKETLQIVNMMIECWKLGVPNFLANPHTQGGNYEKLSHPAMLHNIYKHICANETYVYSIHDLSRESNMAMENPTFSIISFIFQQKAPFGGGFGSEKIPGM